MIKLAHLLVAVMVAASIAAAAPAQATPDDPDSTDSAFLRDLYLVDVPIRTESRAIQVGQAVCEARRSGYSITEVLAYLNANSGISKANVAKLYYAAVLHYCAEFS